MPSPFVARLHQELDRRRAQLASPLGLTVACLAIVVICLVARLALLMVRDYQPRVEFAEMEKLARNLAQSGAFANPYRIPTGPSAHHAPIYPLLLSVIFRLWGYGTVAAWAMVVMNITFAALLYALIPVMARIGRLPVLPAVAAAVVGAVVPFRIMKEVRWETTLAALAVVTAVVVSLWWSRRPAPSYVRSAAVGAVWGLCLLTAPALLPVFVILSVWWAVAIGMERRLPSLPRLGVLVLAAVMVLAPWTIRNYRALGGLMFVRSNFGIEFSVSNHDTAYVLARDNLLIGFPHNYFHEHHPWTDRVHAERVQQIGEVAYNRERLHEALAWCRAHPKRFLELTAGRFWYFWAMPSINQRYKDLLLQPITVLGLIGLVLVWRRDRQAGGVFWSLLLGYPLVYYLVETDSRYRYPIDWAVLFLAAYAIDDVCREVKSRNAVGAEDRNLRLNPEDSGTLARATRPSS